MNNLVYRKRRDLSACLPERLKPRRDCFEPIVEHRLRPRVESGEGTDHAIRALRDDEIRIE